MDMNLVNDLTSELAIAVIVEKKLSHKLGPRDAVRLIDKVMTELHTRTDRPSRRELAADLRQNAFVH